MAGTDPKIASLSAFPGMAGWGKPSNLGASGRVEGGAMPIGGVAPATRPGGTTTVAGEK